MSCVSVHMSLRMRRNTGKARRTLAWVDSCVRCVRPTHHSAAVFGTWKNRERKRELNDESESYRRTMRK